MSGKVSSEYVVLEEVLRRAMDDARELAEKELRSEREEGELYAYFGILEWAKQQADLLGVDFTDKDLKALDPYSLLGKDKAA
jgi:hypothetical protein